MFFHDPGGDRSSQPGAKCFRGVKWYEQTFLDLWWYAFARVRNVQDDNIGLAVRNSFALMARSHGDYPVTLHAVGGVLHEIDQHLFNLAQIRLNIKHW